MTRVLAFPAGSGEHPIPQPPRHPRPYEVRLRYGVGDDITLLGHDRCGMLIAELRVSSSTRAPACMHAFREFIDVLDRAQHASHEESEFTFQFPEDLTNG